MIKRKILPTLEKELPSNKVIVLTGMRRVGKTTLVRYLYEKVTNSRKLYLDLENPLNQSYFTEIDYDKIKVLLETMAEGRGKTFTIFLDEIQYVSTIPSLVKYLSDHYQMKFVLTGSASFYLKHLFPESLAGRKRLFELFPLDFEEFLSYKAPHLKIPTIEQRVDKSLFDTFDKYLLEYLTYGGFPSVVLADSHQEKRAELDDIFTSYFQKEIQLLADFRRGEVMKSLIILLAARVGSKLDITKIASELGATRITIQEYIDFLEGTYFIGRISPYSKAVDVSVRGQKKVYLCDPGIATNIGKTAEAALFENVAYNLLRPYGERFFYQNRGGAEIDFITVQGDQRLAIEVKTHPHSSDVVRLKRIAQKLGISTSHLVSRTYSPLPSVIYPFQL